MAGINQGSIIIENSITNPNSNPKFWIDSSTPLSFFDFLKHTKQVASPVEFNDRYNVYLHDWYTIKGENNTSATGKVRDRYVDLLRDISINFTTAEEKRFLSNIDFNNPQDLLIAIPFYSAKIAEICQFYTKKREQVKYKIEENKVKGTKIGIEKNIFNTIVEYILTDDQDENYTTSSAALSSIINSLDIEIEELFDTYSEYFNIDGDLAVENYDDGGDLRNTYFTANNIIETSKVGDLFLNFEESLKQDIFSKPLVLSGFQNLFSLNIDFSLSDLVSEGNIQEALTNSGRSTIKLSLKRELLEKYIGTDIMYLSTGSTGTSFVSGVLFTAREPSKNILNSRFASIAAISNSRNKSLREIGSFFTPDKLGILYFKTGQKEYRIKTDSLSPNKVYVFPDPEIYGNINNITDTAYEYPLYYIVDNSNQVKNNSFSFTVNDVYNTSYDQLLYAYSSAQEKFNKSTKNTKGLDFSFNYLYNRGVITDWYQDIYGNEYGVIKNIHNNKKNISYTAPEPAAIINEPDYIVIDGYLFKDGIEGYNFNYGVSSGRTFNNSLRTGITARTIDEIGSGNFNTGYPFASGGMFALTAAPVRSLYFREFDPYIEAIYPESYARAVIDGELYDGASLTNGDGTLLLDPVLADSVDFDSSIVNYYNILFEAGLDDNLTLQAVPSGDATFLIDFPISATNAEIADGGSFLTDISISNDYPFVNKSNYYKFNNNFSTTIIDNLTGVYDETTIENANSLKGIVFVKDAATSRIYPLSAVMLDTFSSLPSGVKEEIYSNKIQWLDIYNDIIFIETDNYYIIEKILYENLVFVNSHTPNIYFPTNQEFVKYSKPFFIKEKNIAYFCKTTLLSSASSLNSKSLYPEIYEYNILNHTTRKIYPTANSNDLIDTYSLSGLNNVNITNIKQPDIVYNSRNNIISITMAGEDGNGLGYIFNYKFRENIDIIENLTAKVYRLNTNGHTHNFYETTLSNFVSSTSLSGGVKLDKSEGILIFN
jgi:hypothetical protein